MFSSSVDCYNCRQQVFDLGVHRRTCIGKRAFKSTVECYDCHKRVNDLRKHRAECTAGRRVVPRCVTSDVVDFYGLIDVSGSMTGGKIESAKRAFTETFDKMREKDRVAVITFDTKAFFKLKPRPVGQIRRQNEMAPLMNRIYCRGLTALYDAVWMTVEQVHDKNKKTVIIALTDGADNSSKTTLKQVLALVEQFNNITLNIIHVDDSGRVDESYKKLCAGRGEYCVIPEVQIEAVVLRVFNERYVVPISSMH